MYMTMLVVFLFPWFVSDAYAEETITEADSLEEYIDLTEPQLDHTQSEYGLKRVIVFDEVESLYGAEDAVFYDGQTVLTFPTEQATEEGFNALVNDFGEEKVLLDVPLTLQEAGWGSSFMGLSGAKQKYAAGSRQVTIAVLDTGISRNHEIFEGKKISDRSRSFVSAGGSFADDNGHGTMVSGILAESTPDNVQLLVLKTLNARGEGSTLSLLQAVDYAIEQKADIINTSLGGPIADNQCKIIDATLKKASSKGILICTASGNGPMYSDQCNLDLRGMNFYPAESPYTIAVGGISSAGQRFPSSNYGTAIDFCAPGANLKLASRLGRSQYVIKNGTSFACPYISSCLALLKTENPKINLASAIDKLAAICVDYGNAGWDPYYGYGMPLFGSEEVIKSPKRIVPTVKLSANKYEYSGKAKHPSVTVTYKGKAIRSYSVEYLNDNGKIGTHRVKITLKGMYAGSKTVSFKIVPKKVKLKKYRLFTSGTKILFLWSKSKGKYQICVSTDKKFKKVRKFNTKNTSKMVMKLKKGKTYYVRIRAYSKVGSKNYCSDWSRVYTIKNRF